LLATDSATDAEKSEFDGDSTASVGVMSALLDGGTLNNTPHRVAWWLSGMALDLRFTGHRFNYQPVGFHVT